LLHVDSPMWCTKSFERERAYEGDRAVAVHPARVRRAAQDAGFLVNSAGPAVVRLAPALTLEEEEAAALVSALPEILDASADDGT
ncbi:hypothetical protein ACIQRS_26055, partial [Streptomyces termitum]